MQISPAGIAFIESNEGFASQLYSDNGKPAIGFGHDLQPGEGAVYADGITRQDAEALLLSDLDSVQAALTTLVDPSCTQNQWDALCDFAYNLGVGALKTMLSHGWEQVPAQIPLWCHERIDGVERVNAGLQARRAAEVQMFNT